MVVRHAGRRGGALLHCAQATSTNWAMDDSMRHGGLQGAPFERGKKKKMGILAGTGIAEAVRELEVPGTRLDCATYASLLQQCGNSRAVSCGERVHAHIIHSGYVGNIFLQNLLIQMYGKCGHADCSRRVFNSMRQRNVFSWSIMIAAYAQNGQYSEALALYEKMVHSESVQPNSVTFLNVLVACSAWGALVQGKEIHARIAASEFKWDMALQTSLINMYAKCGSLCCARMVFDEMPRKDIVCWNSMVAAYAQNGHPAEAVELFHKLDLEGMKPNASTFATVVGAFTSPEALLDCKSIEQRALASGFQSSVLVQNALVNNYAKCGSLEEARNTFDKMQQRDVISWTAMIAAYTRQGHHSEALELYQVMDSYGVEPNAITFTGVIGACSQLGALAEGKMVHARILEAGFESDVAVGTVLVNMYAKCGSLEDARTLFDRMSQRDVLCWNIMMAAYAQQGCAREVLELYRKMEAGELQPNAITYTSVLGACSSLEELAEGKKIHARILGSGIESDVAMDTTLLSMYVKCRSLEDARKVFDAMQHRDVISWNIMIGAYIELGRDVQALELYRSMQPRGVNPNNITFASILRACHSLQDLEAGKGIHGCIVDSGIETDAVMDTALINMYAVCGSLDDAKSVFDKACRRDVICWTAMIASYAQAGCAKEALDLYKQMLSEDLQPNSVTYASALSACSSLGDVSEGKAIHASIVHSELEFDMVVQNSLLNMYAKCGSLDDSMRFFERMQHRDVVSWTAMIAAYAHHGYSREALRLLQEMELAGTPPDAVTFTSTLHACSHVGLLEEGLSSFVSMSADHGIEPLEDHYFCMIDLLARAGRLLEAEELICSTQFRDESVAWMTLLGSCRIHSNVELGLHAARRALELDPNDAAATYSLLSNIYAEAGRWVDVARLRKTMQDNSLQNKRAMSCLLLMPNQGSC